MWCNLHRLGCATWTLHRSGCQSHIAHFWTLEISHCTFFEIRFRLVQSVSWQKIPEVGADSTPTQTRKKTLQCVCCRSKKTENIWKMPINLGRLSGPLRHPTPNALHLRRSWVRVVQRKQSRSAQSLNDETALSWSCAVSRSKWELQNHIYRILFQGNSQAKDVPIGLFAHSF